MNKSYLFIVLFSNFLFIQACTNTLYYGEIDAYNSDNKETKVVLYWTKTEPLIGTDKAGVAVLLTECSTRRLNFLERENGIVFFGEPGKDIQADQIPINTQNIPCGKIVNEVSYENIQAGPLAVKIQCKAALRDSFLAPPEGLSSSYIKAIDTPYTYDIMEKSSCSFFGETIDFPLQPTCRQ